MDAIAEDRGLNLRLGGDSGRLVFRPRVVNAEGPSFDDIAEVNERRRPVSRLKVLCCGLYTLPPFLNFLPVHLWKTKMLDVDEYL